MEPLAWGMEVERAKARRSGGGGEIVVGLARRSGDRLLGGGRLWIERMASILLSRWDNNIDDGRLPLLVILYIMIDDETFFRWAKWSCIVRPSQ